MVAKTTPLTLDDFMRAYSDNGPFELIDGKQIPVSPQIPLSAITGFEIARKLADYVDRHKLGKIYVEMPFILSFEEKSTWVKGSRVPDIMFVRAARIAELEGNDPDWQLKPLTIVPDLVVEVISPTDRFSEVNEKVARYLADGVKLVWVVDPVAKTIIVHLAGSSQQMRLTTGDVLEGGTLIDGFKMSIDDLLGI